MSSNYYDEPNYSNALKFHNKIIQRDRLREWERLNNGVIMQIKENYALRLADAAQYNDTQTKYFIEGFCGIPIKNSNT